MTNPLAPSERLTMSTLIRAMIRFIAA